MRCLAVATLCVLLAAVAAAEASPSPEVALEGSGTLAAPPVAMFVCHAGRGASQRALFFGMERLGREGTPLVPDRMALLGSSESAGL